MRLFISLFFGSIISTFSFAAPPLAERVWKVDGVERKALVYVPAASSSPAPVIFAFHGHGGSMLNAARSFNYHTLWPEAICIYMQGLPTPSKLDPEGKKAGWQTLAGTQEDRDLKFFDAVWASAKADYKADEKKVFVTGHSNGGMFTYLLWAERGDLFTAVAPMAAVLLPPNRLKVKPKPALHMTGEKDEIVPFEYQKRSMEAVRTLNVCDPEGKPWESTSGVIGTKYASEKGPAFVSLIHPGPHKFPAEVPGLIVKFFKEVK